MNRLLLFTQRICGELANCRTLAAALGQVAIEKDLREIALGEWEGRLLRQKAAGSDLLFNE